METIKNLSYYRELDKEELSGIYGGVIWYIVGGVIIAVVNEIVSDWDNFKAGLRGQPEIKYWKLTSDVVVKLFNLKTNIMKKTEILYPALREINPEELSIINGGSFAYDLGTVLRFLGIYYSNGMGLNGYTEAVADYLANQYKNGT